MDHSPKLFSLLAAVAVLLIAPLQVQAQALPHNVSLQLPFETGASLAMQLSSPIPGAQITSGFGWRTDPVLKRLRFHAGVDFGAAIGTPVLAAGEGTIEKIGRASDRGRYIIIRHSGQLTSSYAHLSAIAAGLHSGDHIAAHAVIGRVGRSGWATGPNLHFEIFLDGFRVDPGAILASVQASGRMASNAGTPALADAEETAGIAGTEVPGIAAFGGNAVARRIATFNDH
jgi:murein DD-endopeptidase MepM/ murein hydrolase activator NlpD